MKDNFLIEVCEMCYTLPCSMYMLLCGNTIYSSQGLKREYLSLRPWPLGLYMAL